VMILDDRGLSPQQMQSVTGISRNLIEQYRQLYVDLDKPEYQLTLTRLKRLIVTPDHRLKTTANALEPSERKRGSLS